MVINTQIQLNLYYSSLFLAFFDLSLYFFTIAQIAAINMSKIMIIKMSLSALPKRVVLLSVFLNLFAVEFEPPVKASPSSKLFEELI